MLAAREIVKRLGDRTVIDHISVGVLPGSAVVLMGPSGGGKSTVLRCLSLLDPPDAGEIVYGNASFSFPRIGHNQPTLPFPELCVVFQQLFLWPHLRNRDNIDLVLRTDHHRARAHELAERLGIGEALDRFPNESSVGQKQRVALVRALALSPKYLLLDEVTSALDRRNRDLLASILRESMEAGTGVLIITHDLEFARLFSDDILWLEHGQISKEMVR